jgi:hypothetical protein
MKRYQDALGNWRPTPEETYAALMEAMGQQEAENDAPLIVVRRGQRKRLKAPAEIIFEAGGVLRVRTTCRAICPWATTRYAI